MSTEIRAEENGGGATLLRSFWVAQCFSLRFAADRLGTRAEAPRYAMSFRRSWIAQQFSRAATTIRLNRCAIQLHLLLGRFYSLPATRYPLLPA